MNAPSANASGEAPLMTRPWIEIRGFYRSLVDNGLNVPGMLQLVEDIERSRYARALHAWTSMHDLCATQWPVYFGPYDGPHLRMSPLFDGTVDFRYVDTYNEARQWHRRVNERDAFGRLERFLDQLHWIGREEPAAP